MIEPAIRVKTIYVMGPYVKDVINENGETLIDLCNTHEITDGFFKHNDIPLHSQG